MIVGPCSCAVPWKDSKRAKFYAERLGISRDTYNYFLRAHCASDDTLDLQASRIAFELMRLYDESFWKERPIDPNQLCIEMDEHYL